MSTFLLVVSIIIFICMIVFNIIGAVWLGLILEHVFLVPAAYIVVLIIVGNINETACLILALITAAISLIAVIVKPIIAAHNYKKQQEENAQRKKEQEQRNRNLVDAVNRGDKDAVQKLIEKSDDANSIDWNNEKHKYLLEIAVENNDKEMVSLLIDKGADVNRGWEKTPLDCAKDEEIISILRSHGAKTQAEIDADKEEMKKEKDKFFWACKHNDISYVKVALEKNKQLTDVKDETGVIALITASTLGNKEIVELLISYGADVNIHCEAIQDENALICAAYSGHKDIVELLLDNGAIINSKKSDGMDALMWASARGYKDVAELLISKGADVNSKDYEGFSPLMLASQEGHGDLVELLINEGAKVNAKNNDGATAIKLAYHMGHLDIAEFLQKKS